MLSRSHVFTALFACFSVFISCKSNRASYSDHVAWADSVTDHALTLMTGPDPVTGLRYLDSAYNVTPGRGVADVWRKYNVKVNYYSHYDKNIFERSRYVDSMLVLLEGREMQYKFEYAHSLLAKGRLLREQKKENQAFKQYFDGRKFAEKNLDQCSLSDFSNSLGVIRYQQQQYDKAIPYLKQAFEESEACDTSNFHYDFILPQSVLNTTALCFEKLGELDSAVFYYHKALNFIQDRGAEYPQKEVFVNTARAVIEGNLGGAYARLGNFEEAEKHLKTNISINDRPGHPIEDAQTAKLKLARLYLDHALFAKTNTLLGELQSDLETGRGKSSSNSEIWTKWYELKWLYNKEKQNLPEAYHYLERYHTFKDSLDQVNSGLSHADIDQVFKEHEQQYQLSLLQKDNELKTVYLAALIIFLIMTLCVALVIGYYLNLSKKNIKGLVDLNMQTKTTLTALENSQTDNARLLKIVSHDLRNPIGAMTAMAGLLLEEKDRPEEERAALELMKTSGESSLKLVNDLLQVNVPSSEMMEKKPHDLEEIIRYSVDMLQHKAQLKEQTIELDTQPVTLSLNYEKMWRVISNLISNAIKFSEVGGDINVRLEQNGPCVWVSVKDRGIGIPTEVKDKVFDLFTTARRRGTSGEESSGLGLAISKQIVEAHGGRLRFESNPEGGTTFVIELPL